MAADLDYDEASALLHQATLDDIDGRDVDWPALAPAVAVVIARHTPPAAASHAVVVRMPADLKARIEAHAEATERTTAQVVRLAVKRYLERDRAAHAGWDPTAEPGPG